MEGETHPCSAVQTKAYALFMVLITLTLSFRLLGHQLSQGEHLKHQV